MIVGGWVSCARADGTPRTENQSAKSSSGRIHALDGRSARMDAQELPQAIPAAGGLRRHSDMGWSIPVSPMTADRVTGAPMRCLCSTDALMVNTSKTHSVNRKSRQFSSFESLRFWSPLDCKPTRHKVAGASGVCNLHRRCDDLAGATAASSVDGRQRRGLSFRCERRGRAVLSRQRRRGC
jgi:hypothetical protein